MMPAAGSADGPAASPIPPIPFKFALDDSGVRRTTEAAGGHGFGGLPEVVMLITDSGLDADVAARLEAAGPTVVRA
jgi:hypothetical protein